MHRFESLKNATSDVQNLEIFLNDNFQSIYDFFIAQQHDELLALRNEIRRYIAFNLSLFRELNITSNTNLSFLSLLLDVSERFGLLVEFKFLYEHLKEQNYAISKRLQAASLYLLNVNTSDDYLNKYEEIVETLQYALELEEDNEEKVIFTIINFYAQVINNFGQFNRKVIEELKSKIRTTKEVNNNFLHHPIIDRVLEVEIDLEVNAFDVAYKRIHQLLDEFLSQSRSKNYLTNNFLIEIDTIYCELLQYVHANFNAIRQISVNQYKLIQDSSIFSSLQRGVKILTEESQLYAYLNSYGRMHYQKMLSSLEALPQVFFSKEVSIIDWGCGQGMATISFFDYLNSINKQQAIKQITLIEPSEIALKRAALHVRKYDNYKLITLNKDLDSLRSQDFSDDQISTKLHLFSNILDMEVFLLSNLLELINGTFKGENYFICASPYINDMKTERINSFVRYFSKFRDYEIFQVINDRGCEWYNDWTRVIRVFKVKLS